MNGISDKIDKAYSSEPWWYDLRGFLILTFAYRNSLPAQIRHFGNNIRAEHLEAAIGSGTLFEIILKWRKWKGLPDVNVTAFDYAEKMLNGARIRFAKINNISLHRADAARMPWEANSFDSVNVANSIHSFPEIEKSIKEIYRVLKSEGTFAGNCLLYPIGGGVLNSIANKINAWGIKKGILHRPYLQDEIKSYLINSGFNIIYEKRIGNSYDFIVRK